MSRDLERYIERAFDDNGLIELRVPHDSGAISKFFAKSEEAHTVLFPAFWEAARDLNETLNVYTSLNRPYQNHQGRPLRDQDIEVVTRIPLDFDPIRPKDRPSTPGELAKARLVRSGVVGALRSLGFPMPVLGDSGNGAHAIFRANIINDTDWRQVANALYQWMAAEFKALCEQHQVTFDTTVKNPARIWRLYGTTNLKGTEAVTEGRCYREAACTYPAQGWQIVDPKLLEGIAHRWLASQERRTHRSPARRSYIKGLGDYKTLDAIGWFKDKGLYIKPMHRSGIHAVVCPWLSEHSVKGGFGESVIFENPGGWPQFHCNHAHCAGRRIRDVMALWGDQDSYCERAYAKEG
jgi:hypothetical protein